MHGFIAPIISNALFMLLRSLPKHQLYTADPKCKCISRNRAQWFDDVGGENGTVPQRYVEKIILSIGKHFVSPT